MDKLLRRFKKCHSGATAIEYALIAAMIGLAIITATTSVGLEVAEIFEDVETGLAGRG